MLAKIHGRFTSDIPNAREDDAGYVLGGACDLHRSCSLGMSGGICVATISEAVQKGLIRIRVAGALECSLE